MGQGSNENFPGQGRLGQLFFPEPGLDRACIPEWNHHLEKLVKFSIWRIHYFQGVFLFPTPTCNIMLPLSTGGLDYKRCVSLFRACSSSSCSSISA